MDFSLLLTEWPVDPPITLSLVALAVLYALGVRYCLARGIARYLNIYRAAAFYAGLLTIQLALVSPLDYLASQLLLMHMLQHVLLTIVAAPLLVLGAPFWPLWRAFPRWLRRAALRPLVRARALRRLWRGLAGVFGNPKVAWLLFTGGFTLWHIPVLYEGALEQPVIHALEHMTFLGIGVLFWVHVFPAPPFHARLSSPLRILYVGLAAVQGNLVDSIFMFSTAPFYSFYAAVPRLAWFPGMPTPLEDQHIAGALMGTITTVLLSGVIAILLGLWLQEDERAGEQERGRLAARQHGHQQARQQVRQQVRTSLELDPLASLSAAQGPAATQG